MLIVCIWVKIADISATPALILKRYNDSNCSSRDCNISKYKTDFNLLLLAVGSNMNSSSIFGGKNHLFIFIKLTTNIILRILVRNLRKRYIFVLTLNRWGK